MAYIAWDTQLERNVVLKECFPAAICTRDESGAICPQSTELEDCYLQAMVDMQREARILAKLNHERVVRVYDVFESQGGLYYVMPWLEGGSLREKMDAAADAGIPIPVETATQWLVAVLDGLQYLHEQGIIHRDLKPANIMFDESERPVLIDFGASVMMAVHTVTQGEFSAAYAAPEQVSGKGRPFAGTDLFALAATAYELLSGSMPEETLRRMVKDELVPLRQLPGMEHLPEALELFVMHNLQLAPEARDKSAAYWRDVLCGLLPGPPPVARKGRRSWWPALAVAGVGLLGVGAWLVLPSMEPEQTPPVAPEPPVASTDAMDGVLNNMLEAYIEHNKATIESWPAAYARHLAEFKKIDAEYNRTWRDYLTQLEAEIAAASQEERESVDFQLERNGKLQAIFHHYRDLKSDELNRFYREFSSPVDSILTNPSKHYPAFSAQESTLLPLLVTLLEKRYGHYRQVVPHSYTLIKIKEATEAFDALRKAHQMN